MLSLADAIIQEDINHVRAILERGVHVNQLDEYGFTPLIEAAVADNLEIAKLLVNYGANVNMQDATGTTPLHWATENNNVGLAQLLLERGADPNSYNLAGQPVLVMPLLRQHQNLKKLLMKAGASLEFAQDYINAKLLGHLFELVGTADIVDPKNQFVEVDFEGFYLEVTLGLIAESLAQFNSHFAARQLRRYSQLTQVAIQALNRAAQIIKYQQYRVDLQKYQQQIDLLLSQEPLVIPIGYEGHAITFVKFGNILVKCDRREDSRLYDNVFFYKVNHPHLFTNEFIKKIIYEKQTSEFINQDLPEILDLKPITELKVTAQISGNCSWANVEACIPVLLFLLCSNAPDFHSQIPQYKTIVLNFFQQWREWNKDRSLQFCIQSFHESDSIRKACKAELLAAILFQCCKDETLKNKERIESILSVLSIPKYAHVLQNYVKSYCYEDHSEEGKNFLKLLRSYGQVDIK